MEFQDWNSKQIAFLCAEIPSTQITSVLLNYRISANSFRGNYSFLNLTLFTVTFDLYFINLNSCRGNYSREETIQGRKLFAEVRYILFHGQQLFSVDINMRMRLQKTFCLSYSNTTLP